MDSRKIDFMLDEMLELLKDSNHDTLKELIESAKSEKGGISSE